MDEWREAVSGPTPLQTSHLSISRPLECMGRVMEGAQERDWPTGAYRPARTNVIDH